MSDSLSEVLSQVVGPLIAEDSGELFVAKLDAKEIHLHLRGSFSGCPGNQLVIQHLVEPALRRAAPNAVITVSSGELIPEGAVQWTRVQSPSAPPPRK
jgi:Fe-S cluster biogenesis protein NfuA